MSLVNPGQIKQNAEYAPGKSSAPDNADFLPIIYQDADLIAVHKPAGLLVHRSELDAKETRFALQMVRNQIGAHVFPLHRLDKGTSGILVFAKSAEVAAQIMPLFQSGAVHKTYLAVVRGYAPESGFIDHALSRIEDSPRQRRQARNAAEQGLRREQSEPQSAQTAFRSLAQIELPVTVDRYPVTRYSLVAAYPYTGRRHQIRRHLKHLAHPIIGDVRYGKGTHNQYFRDAFGVDRLLLACVRMAFVHPVSGQTLVLRQPVAGQFAELLVRFDWEAAAALVLVGNSGFDHSVVENQSS